MVKLRASVTVEAALVVSTAFIALASVMKWDFQLLDTVKAAMSRDYEAEVYDHSPEAERDFRPEGYMRIWTLLEEVTAND